MNWMTPAVRPKNFEDAVQFFQSERFSLALWDHAECRGYQLYKKDSAVGKRRWLASAGMSSLKWTPEQAFEWGEAQAATF